MLVKVRMGGCPVHPDRSRQVGMAIFLVLVACHILDSAATY
jgi:hypothetical protein